MTGDARKRRLLIVLKSDGVGGVERILAALIPALAIRDTEVDIACHGHPPITPGLLAEHTITHLDPGRLPGLLGRARQGLALRRMVARGDYAAVIGFGPIANALVALTRRRSGPAAVVAEFGNPFIEKRRTWNRLFGWTYRRADVLVVQTEGLAKDMRRSWRGVPPVVVIRSPVPSATPIRPPSEERERVIAGVGRLIPMKGYADLMEAFARLGPEAAGWSVLVVGDGTARAELESQAERLGVAERVLFTGEIPAPWERLANASIFVLCSHHEGYPNVLLEAMASGCTVVAADCRFGPSEMIEDGVSGRLYPVGDVDRLTAHLGTLVADPELRMSLALESTAWAAEQSPLRSADAWLELVGPPAGTHADATPQNVGRGS